MSLTLTLRKMRHFTYRQCLQTRPWLCLMLGWLLLGTAPASAEQSIRVGLPPIYIDQSAWTVDNAKGETVELIGYRFFLRNGCPQGSVTLSPHDQALLGHYRIQRWYTGIRWASLVDHWIMNRDYYDSAANICRFRLVKISKYRAFDGKSCIDIDYSAKKARRYRCATIDPPTVYPPTASNIARIGHDNMGDVFKGKRTIAGQPCLVWASTYRAPGAAKPLSPGASQCQWTGGERWGFGSLGFNSPTDGGLFYGFYRIYLSVVPPASASGFYRVVTNAMTVGKPLPSNAFDTVPSFPVTDTEKQ